MSRCTFVLFFVMKAYFRGKGPWWPVVCRHVVEDYGPEGHGGPLGSCEINQCPARGGRKGGSQRRWPYCLEFLLGGFLYVRFHCISLSI